MRGERDHPFSGFAAGGVGDLNGDGFDDVGVGTNPSLYYIGIGRAYVVFGDPDIASGGPLDLSKRDGSNGFQLDFGGVPDWEWLGMSLDAAGDFNGDGFEDLIVGAPRALEPSLRAFVVFGGSDVGSGGRIELLTLDGADGFALVGVQIEDCAGTSVRGAGDVNGDGKDDLIIHAPLYSKNGGRELIGRAYVVFGTDTPLAGGRLALASLDGSNGFAIVGDSDALLLASYWENDTVDGAVDVNGDGFDDVIVGAMYAGSVGCAYVVFGGANVGAGGIVDVRALDGGNGFVVVSSLAGSERLGASVAGLDDISGDGYDDLIVSDPRYAAPGASFVLFGAAELGAGGSVDLAMLNGTNGFSVEARELFRAGTSVGSAGDVNGDGLGDSLVSGPAGQSEALDEVYVFFGSADIGGGGRVAPDILEGENGFTVTGEHLDDLDGSAVAAAGDVNGDGRDDFLIGAPSAGVRVGAYNLPVGETYLIFGGPPDTDGDALYDGEDNCIHDANADQRDTNDDGFGNRCDADLNGDLVVNFLDLALFKPLLFSADPDADFDGNGVVNFVDVATMKRLFFLPPGPSGFKD